MQHITQVGKPSPPRERGAERGGGGASGGVGVAASPGLWPGSRRPQLALSPSSPRTGARAAGREPGPLASSSSPRTALAAGGGAPDPGLGFPLIWPGRPRGLVTDGSGDRGIPGRRRGGGGGRGLGKHRPRGASPRPPSSVRAPWGLALEGAEGGASWEMALGRLSGMLLPRPHWESGRRPRARSERPPRLGWGSGLEPTDLQGSQTQAYIRVSGRGQPQGSPIGSVPNRSLQQGRTNVSWLLGRPGTGPGPFPGLP